MNTRFIDTNIFIDAYFREGVRAKRCAKLLESKDELTSSVLVISEIEWVLRSVYELDRERISKILASILGLANLEIAEKKVLVTALKLFKETAIDWTDCVSAAMMQKQEIEEIYSFDEDFDKFDFLKRIEP